MKQGWEIKDFVDVCTLVGGSQPSKNVFIYEPKDGYIRLIQVRDYRTNKYITYIPKEKAKRFCTTEDIMIGRYGPPIFGIFKGLEGAYNVALMKAVVNEKICNKDFFYLFLQTDSIRQFVEYSSKRAAGQDGVRKELLDKYPVPLPPLPEQQRIVSILNEAFAAIAKAKTHAEQNLKNARELFESYLQGVFEKKGEGWEEKRIDEICKLINGRAYKKDELLDKGKYRVLRVGNFFTSDHWYYSDLELDEDKYCDKEDLLYAWSASFGPRIWKEEKVIYHYHIWKVIPDENLVTRDFLFTLFEWDKEKIKAAQGTGTTMIHVSKGSMENRIVPVPPLKEQQTIVRQLDALRAETQKLEAIYQKKIADLEELKKSILQKAFAGELVTSTSISAETAVRTAISLQKIEGISATDLQAGITAIALQKHVEKNQQHSFHHVKVEKIVHLCEYILNIDLERNPVKDAAGPNDFPHAKKVESRARKAGFYNVFKNGEYYDYQQGSSINSVIQKAQNCLKEKANTLSQVIDMLIPMNMQQAEIVATVYAAWNNLILLGNQFDDEDIVTEARENWRAEKLKISRDKFFSAIEWMRESEIFIPKGNGKIVVSK